MEEVGRFRTPGVPTRGKGLWNRRSREPLGEQFGPELYVRGDTRRGPTDLWRQKEVVGGT